MTSRLMFGLITLITLVSGCATAPQQPISFAPENLSESSNIGVLIDVIPTPQTNYPGAGCLLCYAAAAAANSTLSNQVKTFSIDDLNNIDAHLVSSIKSAGYSAVLIENTQKISELPKLKSKAPNSPKHDFSRLAQSYGVDHILVVEFNFVGVQRNYSSYIPTGAPQAIILGASYLVDLTSNTYDWYKPLTAYQSADGEWDEPPNFPGLTNAYYQAVESIRDEAINSFTADKAPPQVISQNSAQ